MVIPVSDLAEARFGVQAVGAEAGLPVVEARRSGAEAGVQHPLRAEPVVAVTLLDNSRGVEDGGD
jgi:hypothetical protein